MSSISEIFDEIAWSYEWTLLLLFFNKKGQVINRSKYFLGMYIPFYFPRHVGFHNLYNYS